MAIKVSFNGATIRKPGSYLKTIIDLGGNFPLSPVGVVGLIGEAPRGKPGSAELIANNVFTADRMTELQDKYGPASQIADAASLAFEPSNDGQITNGAQACYVFKTNSSVRASVTIPSYGTGLALEYGEGGNLDALTIEASTAEVLPSLAGVHYLPSSIASAATDFKAAANGLTKQNVGVLAAYAAAAGGPDAFVSQFTSLTSLAASGGTSTALFSGTGATTTLTAANASGVTSLTLAVAGTLGSVAAGDIFVLSGVSTASFNGVYLCTVGSTATTISGVKLKDLGSNAITLPVPGVDAFAGANTASRAFTSMTLSVDAAQAQAQGASLQLSLLNNSIYGGDVRDTLSASAANVGTIKFGNAGQSFASVTVTLVGATFLSTPEKGDIVWILPNSQLAAVTDNCGAYYVTAASQSSVTMTKVDQSAGTYTAVAATTISVAGVDADLKIFKKAQATPNFAGAIASSAEGKVVITVDQTRDQITEVSDEIGGKVALKIGYGNSSATAATVTINQTTKRLTTVVTGVSGADLNVNLLQYPTLSALASFINAQSGYMVEVDAVYQNTAPSLLDDVTTLGILSLTSSPIAPAGRVKKDKSDVKAVFDDSSVMSATITASRGLPAALAKTFLAGGIEGSTSAASILAALDEFEKVRINTVVPLFSRDSALDIAEGKTNASSTYLIDSIHAAVKSHCILMSNTKNRSERHAVLAFRGSYADTKVKSATLSSFRAQLVFQDVNALSTDGNVKWMQPHMLAAEVAGMRSGAVVGLPLTFKFFNISGLRHTESQLDELPEDVVIDFEPRTMADDAIDSGLTFLEAPVDGGFRLVVDNTTYSKDGNWVYNRMATLHAADVVAYDFRKNLEDALVGARNTDISKASVETLCHDLLSGYKSSGLLGSTADAPNGYKSLNVRIQGNTILIGVTVILVEGIDFVLTEVTLKRNISQ